VIDPSKENVKARIEDLTEGKGIDVIVETSGNARAISDTVNLVKRGGRIVYVGMPVADEVPINMNQLIDSELDVYGIFRYVNTYPAAIQALSRSNVDITKVITHKVSLKNIEEGIDIARLQKDTSIKVMIYPNL